MSNFFITFQLRFRLTSADISWKSTEKLLNQKSCTLLKLHNHILHFSQVLEDLEVEDDLDQLDSLQLLQILQNVPANQIVQRNGLFEEFMFALVPWKPIVDGNHASKPFIPDDPRHNIYIRQ